MQHRALDDATYATLSSLTLFNNVEVVSALAADPHFLKQLFTALEAASSGDPQWADLVAFLQVCVCMWCKCRGEGVACVGLKYVGTWMWGEGVSEGERTSSIPPCSTKQTGRVVCCSNLM
jgi:hypothetical protein